jgi:TPR repeat protein
MRRGVKIFGGVVAVLVGLYVWPFLVPLPQRTTEPIVPPFPAEYGAAAVADLEVAETLYREGAFQAAYDLWKPLAEAGNPEAQFRIGRLYDRGELFAQDEDEGLRWFQLAAEQNHAMALSNSAAKLLQAGADLCDPKVQDLTRAAAEAGASIAQFNLGIALGELAGCGQVDTSARFYWLQKSAAQGFIDAIAKLIFLDPTIYQYRNYEEDLYLYLLLFGERKNYIWPLGYYLSQLVVDKQSKEAATQIYLEWRPVLQVRLP